MCIRDSPVGGGTGTNSGTPVVAAHPRMFYPSRKQMELIAAGGAPATAIKDLIYSGFIPFAR